MLNVDVDRAKFFTAALKLAVEERGGTAEEIAKANVLDLGSGSIDDFRRALEIFGLCYPACAKPESE
jgi:hypothetical protein